MNMMSRRVVLAGAALVIHLPVRAFAHDDKDHITHLLKAMFDTPENPLSVDPVVVRGDNAIAGWVQGDRGGRALLWRVKGEWQIRLCSGDSLKDAAMLESANIGAEDAKTMADELAAAEAKLDPVIVAKFSTFEGTVMIDGEHGHHNHQHGTSQTQ